jgi:hypothetical protein
MGGAMNIRCSVEVRMPVNFHNGIGLLNELDIRFSFFVTSYIGLHRRTVVGIFTMNQFIERKSTTLIIVSFQNSSDHYRLVRVSFGANPGQFRFSSRFSDVPVNAMRTNNFLHSIKSATRHHTELPMLT